MPDPVNEAYAPPSASKGNLPRVAGASREPGLLWLRLGLGLAIMGLVGSCCIIAGIHFRWVKLADASMSAGIVMLLCLPCALAGKTVMLFTLIQKPSLKRGLCMFLGVVSVGCSLYAFARTLAGAIAATPI